MNHFADVVLPLTVDKTFTYSIPENLAPSVRIGVRALVPFGRKVLTGLVVALPPSSSVPGLKPIKDVVDATPIMSDELLSLCRWIASYYFAPLGDVVKAAIPHGLSSSSRRYVIPVRTTNAGALEALTSSAPKRARVLSVLLDRGPLFSTELKKVTGFSNIHSFLNDLERDGLIVTEERVSQRRPGPQTVEFILLEKTRRDEIRAMLSAMSPRKKRARMFLEALLAIYESTNSTAIPVREILRRSGTDLAIARQFIQQGLLTSEKREISRLPDFGTEDETLHIKLNAAQRSALAAISAALDAGEGGTFLLHGVTGSGKTQVYIETIRHCLACGKNAAVLVPEIALTPQMVRRFRSHFGAEVAVVHSRMSAGERYDAWRLASGQRCRIVIGPRSAIFAPLPRLGLIVVDEEHESSYKQFDASPRYNARDVAVVRGDRLKAVVVLGSATPSAESYTNALSGKYRLLELPDRIDNIPMPPVTIVDMVEERKRVYISARESLSEKRRPTLKGFIQPSLSTFLVSKIEDRLSRSEGVILLQNRRGFAPFVECTECGYVASCENCNVTLTYHLTKKHLRCHYCGIVRQPPILCPDCGGTAIALRGIGTQRVEEEVQIAFPKARILRMDLDTTTSKGSHERILRKFGSGEADILLGTQMVAKGLDFARVTLVGVISADTQMLLPDFRASERTFQLLTQVAGRAGRSTLRGEVVIQTHQPAHPVLVHVVHHDYRSFMEEELLTRKEPSYPPYSRLALVESRGTSEEHVRKESEAFAAALRCEPTRVEVLGPAPAVIGKINRNYRSHVLVKSLKERDPAGQELRHTLRSALAATAHRRKRDVRLIIDMDPVGLL
jgi:primosomal protein N' (replication factor Y)